MMAPVLTGKRIFITGADGFIGSHLVEAAVRAGGTVKALSCYSSFDTDGWLDDIAKDVRANVEITRGDVRDLAYLRQATQGVDIVLHLAALIGIPYSYVAPSSYVDVNITGSLNVFLAAREAGVGRIVHTSTSEVYGSALTRPINEDHPLQGQSPYSASKIGADKMAEAMVCSFELPIVTLRPFNTFGPRQSQRAVIPTVIRQALDPSAPVIEVGDTSTERDWTFVEDTAAAFLHAGTCPTLTFGEAYNAGTGNMVTVATMIEEVRSIAATKKEVVSTAARLRPTQSEVRALQADSTRFEKTTGWRAQTTLRAGLEKTVAWWAQRGSGAFSKPIAYRI